MPACYAHMRFGAQLLQTMPKETMRPVRHFRRMFDMGLQGPDFFFYYNPLIQTEVGALASKFHHQTGREFFTRVCQMLKENPTEAGLAYLYGLLGHYCLDSLSHPFVKEATGDGAIGHVELETEFDRYLLSLDGKIPAHNHSLHDRIKLTRGECVTVAAFYPPATPGEVSLSVGNMARFRKFLAGKNRKFLAAVMKRTPGSVPQHLMPEHANHKCLHLNKGLLERYQEAMELYPQLLAQLLAHMETGDPLGEAFEKDFG